MNEQRLHTLVCTRAWHVLQTTTQTPSWFRFERFGFRVKVEPPKKGLHYDIGGTRRIVRGYTLGDLGSCLSKFGTTAPVPRCSSPGDLAGPRRSLSPMLYRGYTEKACAGAVRPANSPTALSHGVACSHGVGNGQGSSWLPIRSLPELFAKGAHAAFSFLAAWPLRKTL